MFLYNIEDTQEASSLRISITFDFFSKSNNFLMFTEPFLLLYILTGIWTGRVLRVTKAMLDSA